MTLFKIMTDIYDQPKNQKLKTKVMLMFVKFWNLLAVKIPSDTLRINPMITVLYQKKTPKKFR